MAAWTHRLCERCWFDGPPAWPAAEIPGMITEGEQAGAYRMPTQVIDPETRMPEPGVCCGCGGMTVTGIYIRADENKLLCKGRHYEPDAWSRVGERV